MKWRKLASWDSGGRQDAEQELGSGRWVFRESQDFVPVLSTSESEVRLHSLVLCGGD